MSNISELTNKIEAVKAKFKLDNTDLLLLGIISERWERGGEVRVTEVTLKFGKGIGSPANIHYRLTTDLVKLRLVRLKTSKEDARVKHIVKGIKFDAMEEYLGGL